MLINTHSRCGAQDLDAVFALLRGAGIEVERLDCPPAGEMSSLIQAHARGRTMVIIGGGDGTLNAALEGMVACGLPLGLLPLGTANDLARTLGIPADPVAAARAIAAGHVRHVDLGWVNGKHFVNVASMGLSVEVTRALSRDLKRRWGRLGYGLGALMGWRRTKPFGVHIRSDGEQVKLAALQVAVGNGRHFGGGMTVAEDARIDDGRLDLFALEPVGLLTYMALLPRLKLGRHGQLDHVRTWHGQDFEVDTMPCLPVNTDGEITTSTPARFRICRGALAVLVPPPGDG